MCSTHNNAYYEGNSNNCQILKLTKQQQLEPCQIFLVSPHIEIYNKKQQRGTA